MVQLKRTIAILLAVITLLAVLPITALGGVKDSRGARISTLPVPTLVTGAETAEDELSEDVYRLYYTNADYITENYSGLIIPMQISKKGKLFIEYAIESLGAECYVEVYTDSSLQTCIGSEYITTDNFEGTLEFQAPKTGTYYVVFFSSAYAEYYNEIVFLPYVVSNQNRTLSSGKWAAATYNEYYTYYKISVTDTRKLVTVYSDSDNIDIFLLDSKKNSKQEYSTTLNKGNKYRASYSLTKGTYYICTQGTYDDYYRIKYTQAAYPTLTINKYSTFSQADGDMNLYYKFKAARSGYVTIKTKNFSGYITLCNSSIKAISKKCYVENGNVIFGVTKGTTYYVRINDYSGTTSSIGFTNAGITDKSGSTRAKSRSIYTGNTYKGYISAGKNVNDWYKFKLGSPKYWAINLNLNMNEYAKVRVYDRNGKIVSTYTYWNKKCTVYSTNKWAAGTYYICISRNSTKDSGYYSMNIKLSNSFIGG